MERPNHSTTARTAGRTETRRERPQARGRTRTRPDTRPTRRTTAERPHRKPSTNRGEPRRTEYTPGSRTDHRSRPQQHDPPGMLILQEDGRPPNHRKRQLFKVGFLTIIPPDLPDLGRIKTFIKTHIFSIKFANRPRKPSTLEVQH